jgi:hypothetical protein
VGYGIGGIVQQLLHGDLLAGLSDLALTPGPHTSPL